MESCRGCWLNGPGLEGQRACCSRRRSRGRGRRRLRWCFLLADDCRWRHVERRHDEAGSAMGALGNDAAAVADAAWKSMLLCVSGEDAECDDVLGGAMVRHELQHARQQREVTVTPEAHLQQAERRDRHVDDGAEEGSAARALYSLPANAARHSIVRLRCAPPSLLPAAPVDPCWRTAVVPPPKADEWPSYHWHTQCNTGKRVAAWQSEQTAAESTSQVGRRRICGRSTRAMLQRCARGCSLQSTEPNDTVAKCGDRGTGNRQLLLLCRGHRATEVSSSCWTNIARV